MSLILDALRKSEAERRRGQSPDLYTELPPPSRRTAKRMLPWQWLALVAGTLAIAGWAARGYWNESPTGAPNAVAAVDARDLVDTGPTPSEIAPSSVLGDGASIPPVTMPTAAMPRPATTASLPATSTMTPSGFTPAPVGPATAGPVPARTAPATQAPAKPDPPVVEAPVVAMSAAPPRPRETLATAPAPTPAIEAPPEPASPARAEPSPAPATVAPLRLSDLSTADRQQLPPLKISMHMWGQGPSQRFAIIDGARVTEGDRIGPAVVDEISADGVVLAWNGLRVKLPR
ncbi:general secretion pathway protein B [Lysobacter niastensis]|uniref:General secretion pathway protein B n=1 Tax=Lysobacter niastensis TaxID=380629 RepID=A0ABU1WBA7_9GAMM|nr:general secretion pathway protein GspB [Lysobacter niastensis]MDR7134739.1 general secretion pathway protein B [Lysobacter niastensis]